MRLEHGYTVQEVYIDEDYSGADRRRPAFNQMLAAAERREFDVILAKTQSRFTRDMELVEKYLHGQICRVGHPLHCRGGPRGYPGPRREKSPANQRAYQRVVS